MTLAEEFARARMRLFPGPRSREHMAAAMGRDPSTLYRWEQAGDAVPQVAMDWVRKEIAKLDARRGNERNKP